MLARFMSCFAPQTQVADTQSPPPVAVAVAPAVAVVDKASTTTPANPLSNALVIFVLGGPGSGKGTQCARLVDDFALVHLSAGDLLRAELARKSDASALIQEYIDQGKIVPMEITIQLLKQAMEASPVKKFLVDGFPRQMDQALYFEKEITQCKLILFFDCPEDVMLARLLKRGETSGRTDDNIESIKKRFKTFKETSMPVVEYFEKLGKVHSISCVQGPDEVYAVTRAIVEKVV